MLLKKHDPEGEDGKTKGRLLSGGEKLCKNFYQIHESFVVKGATPRGYLNYLHTYIQVFNQKKDGIEQKQKHLQVVLALFLPRLEVKCCTIHRTVSSPPYEGFLRFVKVVEVSVTNLRLDKN